MKNLFFLNRISESIAPFFLILFFTFFSIKVSSQNLVMNGGFEAPNNKVLYGTYLLNKECVTFSEGINFRDDDAKIYEQKLGKKSAGCFTWRNDTYFKPSVLALNLREKLLKDKWYEVSYFIKHGYGIYATNCNGLSFSTAGKTINYFKVPFKTLSTVNPSSRLQVINNQEWEQHRYLYKANGGENIILMGHVFYKDTVRFEEMKTPKERYKIHMTLYMFDGVKVIPFNNQLYVLFDLESAELTFKEKIILDDLSNYLSGLQYNKVVLNGYADKTGKAEKNKSLSSLRTEVVKKYLLDKNIDVSKIYLTAKGSTDEFDKDNLGLNRRVEIVIE